MHYELVIFDNDGVLVDSEPISNRILAACLTEAGFPTTTEESVRDFMGAAMHRVHDVVRERTGGSLPEGFDATYHGRVFAAFERELEPVEGAGTVLEKLAADGVPYCLASSGGHERIRVALRKTGLYGRFGEERIFSSQDVGRGKPAPDLFLHAARTMGVPPERCAVVEDSALGVAAARAAGMDVYGYTAMTPAAKLQDATALFASMSELPALLLG
ncbi:MAG: HAD family hydrolase [Streptomyces sp.]|nr:HAD family hydrolase [Streptomyces sp.]